MLETLVSKKQANIKKGKTKNRKTEETKQSFTKGVDRPKANLKNDGILKGKRKQNRKKRRLLKTSLLGKSPVKLQENSLFQKRAKTTRKSKTTQQK